MPHLLEGVRLPDHISGHPGLELCNTRANWPGEAEHEYLHSARVVAVWAVDAGLLPSSVLPAALTDAAPGGNVVAAATSLRAALYRCARDDAGAVVTSEDWDAVTRAVVTAREVAVLRRPSPSAPAAWALDPRAVATARTCDEVARLGLHAAALAADDLLRTAAPGDVQACPGAGCGWLFLDPRHRRRWCTMSVCGNRHKVRRHAARVRAGAPAR